MKISIRFCAVFLLAAFLAACNTAGELPEGPTTPIVPPPAASRPATVAPAASTAAPAAPAPAPIVPARQPAASAAAQTYAARCAPCHGTSGKGDGPQGAAVMSQMGGKLPDFTNETYARSIRPADWFAVLTSGRMQKGMPPFTSLSDDQRWDLVAYLYTFTLPQDRLDRGKAVYADKCTACHGATGKSDKPGTPDLSDPAQMANRSQADFDQAVTSGKGTMPAIALGQDDLKAVNGYARSLSMSLDKQPVQASGQGVIEGALVNGTAGAKTPGSLPLTLYALPADGSSILYTRTITAEANGSFRFDKLDPAPTNMYGIQVYYGSASYTSDPLTFPHGQAGAPLTITAPITVYETTNDPANVRIDQMHMFFEFNQGTLTVGQLFVVSNSGDRAYIGADGTSLRLPLPSGATNVRFQDGELGGKYKQVQGGFADTEAVPPGSPGSQMLLSYDLPYNGKKLDMSLSMNYPVSNVNVLLPEGGPKLTSAQLQDAGVRQTQGGNMLTYSGKSIAPGQALQMSLSGAAPADPASAGAATTGGSSGLSPLLLAGAGLLLIALGIVAYVWLRQRSAEPDLKESEVEDPQARRDELVAQIADLDDDYEAGRIAEADYKREREALKQDLVDLMRES